MYASDALRNTLATALKNEIDGIGLTDADGAIGAVGALVADMSDTTDTIQWSETDPGKLDLNADMTFTITVSNGPVTVRGWRAYAEEAEAPDEILAGADFPVSESFNASGEYTLKADGTFIEIDVPGV